MYLLTEVPQALSSSQHTAAQIHLPNASQGQFRWMMQAKQCFQTNEATNQDIICQADLTGSFTPMMAVDQSLAPAIDLTTHIDTDRIERA